MIIITNFKYHSIIIIYWIPLIQKMNIRRFICTFIFITCFIASIHCGWKERIQKGPRICSFEEFKKIYNKSYATDEIQLKSRVIFQENLLKVKTHNSNPRKTYTIEINEFADLRIQEFEKQFLQNQNQNVRSEFYQVFIDDSSPNLPDIDWVQRKKVTSVKHQGLCKACYAFAVLAAVQSAILIAREQSVDLSQQQVVQCSGGYNNSGCDSGNIQGTYKYLMEVGVTLEKQVPYKPYRTNSNFYSRRDDPCRKINNTIKIKNFVDITGCPDLERMLQNGPIPVLVDSSNWALYHSGILNDCGNQFIGHAALLVGFTSQYWKIKNSWGQKWGQEGYIRISKGNTCGICQYPSYLILQ